MRARKLPKLAQKYFRGGRKAADKESTLKQLHRFRLQTKRFRYALELFRPIYGPSLDRHLKSLRGIQDALGKVSDYQTILRIDCRRQDGGGERSEGAAEEMKEFREEWKKFDSDGQLQRWKAYLTACRRRSPQAQRTQNINSSCLKTPR